MKPIKFIEKDGTVILFNPAHITDVKAVHSEYNKNWCIVINVNRGGGYAYTHTELYDTEIECKSALDKIEACFE